MMVYHISDFTSFFQSLDQCRDDLTLVMPDGREYDWRTDRDLFSSMLQSADAGKCDKLELKVNNAEDTSRILCYLLEAAKN